MHFLRHFLLCTLLVLCHHLYGQDSTSSVSSHRFFAQRDFGKYFVSDIYAPVTKIHAGWGLNLREYNISTSRYAVYVPYNETSLGVEIPVYLLRRKSPGGKESKFSVSIPISANIWFDFLEDETAPVLNTDYRFALAELNYFQETNWGPIKNFSVKLIPFFHESTHIGDELTLFRVQNNQPIVRVNVSYEVAELALTINDANQTMGNNHSFRIGIRTLIKPKKGWYSIRPAEGDVDLVVNSTRRMETAFQYQHQRTNGWIAGKRKHFILSAEVRDRVRFGYPFDLSASPDAAEDYGSFEAKQLCFNTYAGWKFKSGPDQYPNFGAYLRWYAGINPHGQFRNIPLYDFLGVAFVYEL
jgi:hypothetical protein